MTDLLPALEQVRRLATAGPLRRLLAHPARYLDAMYIQYWRYPRQKRGVVRRGTTFYGRSLQLLLPAGLDIYLTGGKTHDSEIRLACYLIRQLQAGQTFFDIGAHFGYFSLLAAELVGREGKVVAFEAAPATYAVLQTNTADTPQVRPQHLAVAEESGEIAFYEFPALYSEYNSINTHQYQDESWFETAQPQRTVIPSVSLDDFCRTQQLIPHSIKIDVEGAELQVIRGAKQLLHDHGPTIIMEYLAPDRSNEAHRAALDLLREWGYNSYRIDQEGRLQAVRRLDAYLAELRLESDNVVLVKG